MPARCRPHLGLPSLQGRLRMQDAAPSIKPHAGITPIPPQCWCRGLLVSCGAPWSHCNTSPQRAEQSLCRALVAQSANPSGTMWEEICFLNVSHYQLMGMLANERAQRHGGGRGRATGRAVLPWGLAVAALGQPVPPKMTTGNSELWLTRMGWIPGDISQWGQRAHSSMSLSSRRRAPVA